MKRFEDKVVIVTGAAHGIGLETAKRFEQEGARVYTIDQREPASWIGDLSSQKDIEEFVRYILSQESRIDCIVHNAPPLFKGIDECSYEQFSKSLAIGVTAPYYLTKLLKDNLSDQSSIVCISSSRDRMSQPQSESYSAAKGGIHALTHSMAASLAPRTRVNSVSPGWIDVADQEMSRADHLQQPAGRVGKPADIAAMVLFLCSEEAGFITGENILIDGGMSHLMIYHDENGWSYRPD